MARRRKKSRNGDTDGAKAVAGDEHSSPPAPRPADRSPQPGQLLTPDEVADRLRVTAEQIRSLIRRGELTAINVGVGRKRPRYRLQPEAVDEFLARRSGGGKRSGPRRVRRLPPIPDHFPNLR